MNFTFPRMGRVHALLALTAVAAIACGTAVSTPIAPIATTAVPPVALTAIPIATPIPLVIAAAEPYFGPPEQPAPEPDLLAPALSSEEREKLGIFRDPNLGSS
jgi:hypothetical protein